MRLKSFTAEPAAIACYGPLVTDDRRRFVLKSVRAAGGGSPDMLVARVEGVATREAAEALNRLRLYVGRDQLPPPEGEDEFLAADLMTREPRNNPQKAEPGAKAKERAAARAEKAGAAEGAGEAA